MAAFRAGLGSVGALGHRLSDAIWTFATTPEGSGGPDARFRTWREEWRRDRHDWP